MARKPRLGADRPLEERLLEAEARWLPLPVGLLLKEAREKIEYMQEEMLDLSREAYLRDG
jgi:hypothetical protein